MSFQVKINFDLKLITKRLEGISESKWPGIINSAATETAFFVRNKVRSEMPKYIDRPKPFTVNAIFVKKGTPRNPEAVVQWRKPSNGVSGGRYLRPTVTGGGRFQKGLERLLSSLGVMPSSARAVPTDDAPKDAFGNVPSSLVRRIVLAIKVNPTGRDAFSKTKGVRKNQAFFVVPTTTGNLAPGIYERRATGFGGAVRRLYTFVTAVTYRKTFPFYEIGSAAARERFPVKLDEAIAKATGRKP